MAEVFFSALGAVATLFLFVLGGFLFAHFKMVKSDFSGQLSGVVFKFFLPAMLVKMIILDNDMAGVLKSSHLLIICTVIVVAGLPLGHLVSRLMRGKIEKAPSAFACMFPNYIFMGMPVILALYGTEASAALAVYSLPIGLLVSSLGYAVLASSGGFRWRALFTPCTVSILIGFAWLALGIPVPKFVSNVLTTASGVVSPMAMFQVGLVIGSFDAKSFTSLKSTFVMSLVRLIALPCVVALVLGLLGFTGSDLCVPVMISAMPVAANMALTAGAIGRHEDISAQLVFLSTVMSLVTIPVMAVVTELLQRVFA